MKNKSYHLDVHIKKLPPALAKTLRQATHRIRRILFLRGLLAVAATTLIALLLIMAVDAAVVIYSPAVRWGLSLAGLAAVVWVAARMLVRPMTLRLTPSRIAALIEQRHPELEERLSTVVELMAMPETYGRGSEQLVKLITEAAEADARHVTPKQEFTGRTVKPKLVAAAVATAVLGVLFAMFPEYASLLALRALAPFAEIDNVFAKSLTVMPGGAVVLLGEPLEVEVAVGSSLSGNAYLRRQFPKGWRWGREIKERMRQVPAPENAPESERHYRQLFPEVEETFRYRIACGHALTRYYTVTAVLRPDAEVEAVRCTYPAYTGKPAVTLTNAAAGIIAPVGTFLELSLRLNRPDIFGAVSLPPQQEWPIASNATQRVTCHFTLAKEEANTRMTVLLRDSYGFTNNPIPYPVIAIPDRPPAIGFTRPDRTPVRLARNARLAIGYRMTDDYGVTNAVLLVARNDEPFEQHTALRNYTKMDADMWAGAESFDLSALDLNGVSKLRLQLAVEDNLPKDLGGPQAARSNILTIELDDGARALEVQQYQESIKKLQDALRQIMEQMKKTEHSTEELRSAFDRKEELNAQAQQKLDNIRQDIAKAEQDMQALAEDNQDSALKDLAEKLDKLREEQIEAARQTAEEAQLAKREDQPLKVRDLEKRLEDAVKSTEDLLREAQEFNQKLDRLAALDELAMREQRLADNAEQAKQAPDMNNWRNQQEDVRNNFNNQVNERPEAKLAAMETRKERLAELAQDVKALAAEQQQLREQTAQNQQNAAEQAAQEQALAQKIDKARQQADDIRQDMYRFGDVAQPTHNPLEQVNNSLNQAQQKANEAAQNLQREQDTQDANQQRQQHNEALQRQQDARQQLENASRQIENAQREMQRAIERQAQRIGEKSNPFRNADLDKLRQNRETFKALSEEAQHLAAEQAQLTQAQREAAAEKQQAEREQRPYNPSQDNAQNAQHEQDIAQHAQDLNKQVEAIRNDMQQMGDTAKPLTQPLQEAKRDLDSAQRHANDAAQALQNQPRQPHDALWREEHAQKDLENAAALLMQTERRLDQMIAQAEQQQQPQDGQAPDTPPQSMDAADHMREAAREAAQAQQAAEQQQSPDDHMQQAQQEAQTAADQMRQMVQQEAQRMNVPMEHLPSNAMSATPRPTKPQQRPSPPLPLQMPQALRDQQLPDSEWFRLRGEISAQAMDEALRRVSPEYRELVRMYFRELSKQKQ